MTIKIKEYQKKKKYLFSKDSVKFQHDKGKLTARERLNLLLDKDTFTEIDEFVELQSHNFDLQERKMAGDGVITGYGKINNKQVYVYAQDFSFIGGSMGEMHNKKINKIIDLAIKTGCPYIGLLDSGGARIQEGVHGLDGGGKIFHNNTMASGVIPQISAILGPCAGIAVYSPALTDFVFMVEKLSYMFITGPDVIKSVTGETINFENLGGAQAQSSKSGNAHFVASDEKSCILNIKKLMTYLPQNNMESPPYKIPSDSPNRKNSSLAVPDDPKKVYDMKNVLQEVLDKNSFFEVHENYAANAIVGFGRLNGHVIGFIANQPNILAGCLDINCSDKISRFVRFCDCFNIPIINFVDVTGYLPGTDQEHNGIIRHGAKMLYAYSEASVPKISIVLRKAYGGAYIALVSKDMGFDYVFAWPMAEIAVMGAEQAVNIVNRKEIEKKPKLKAKFVEEFSQKFLNPYEAAKLGKVDQIIDPSETRQSLIKALEALLTKRDRRISKKHGNMPL